MARLVMVHGAFSDAHVWDRVAPGLKAAGHTVETLDLPGQGEDPTPVEQVTLDRYAAKVIDVLSEGPPAVLVGHSMGGMSITQAAARAPELIHSLIYVAAFLPQEGESLMELTGRPEAAGDMIQANIVVEGEPPVARLSGEAARAAIFNCCTETEADWGVAHRGGQPVIPMGDPLQLDPQHLDAFTGLARRYVTTLQDNCIQPRMQRFMLERAGAAPVIAIDTDHAPYLSRPQELVEALDTLARIPAPVIR